MKLVFLSLDQSWRGIVLFGSDSMVQKRKDAERLVYDPEVFPMKLQTSAKVNIANFHLGRDAEEGDKTAVALVEIDDTIDAALLKKIAETPSVKQAKVLSFK